MSAVDSSFGVIAELLQTFGKEREYCVDLRNGQLWVAAAGRGFGRVSVGRGSTGLGFQSSAGVGGDGDGGVFFRARVAGLEVDDDGGVGAGLSTGVCGERQFCAESVGGGACKEGVVSGGGVAAVGRDERGGVGDERVGVGGAGCGVVKGSVSPSVVVGSASFSSLSGSVSSVGLPGAVSERTLANRRKRELKKLRKQRKRAGSVACSGSVGSVCGGSVVPEWRRGARGSSAAEGRGFFAGASAEVKGELVRTRAERLAAENALAAYKAERQLRLEKAKDEGQMLKRQETQLLRDVELNRVRIEKAHSTLLATGNVAGERGGGFAQTVVSSSSSSGGSGGVERSSVGCSISPSSSVTDREVHALMKEVETLRMENAELVASGGKLKEKAHSTGTGYTANSRGELAEHHRGPWGPESYRMGADGKFHEDRGCDFYDFDDGY